MTDACLFRPKELPGKSAVWEVTRKCHLKCPHCCSEAGSSFSGIGLDEAMEILDILEMNGITEILFSGGEPLLWEPLYEILKSAKERGIECCLSTTGYSFDEDAIDRILDLNIESLHISLDSWNREGHDHFRGVDGVFDKTVSIVEKAGERGILVIASILIHSDLLDHIDELMQLLYRLNITEANFNFWIPVGRGLKNRESIIPDAEIPGVYQKIKEAAEKYKINANSRRIEQGAGGLLECHGGINVFFVDAEGRSAACSWAAKKWPELLDHIEKEGIITGKSRKALTQMKKKYLCNGCGDSVCGKGCPMYAEFHAGDGDPLCFKC